MRSLVRGTVVSVFGLGLALSGAGFASAHGDDADLCTYGSCNTANWYWDIEFSDDDTQLMNFGVISS